jgi:hypothetical protein
MHEELKSVAAQVQKAVNWELVQNRFSPAAAEEARESETGAELVALLRNRHEPHLGYPSNYLKTLRHAAGSDRIEAARGKIEDALNSPLLMGHANNLARVGSTDLIVGLDEELSLRAADWVIEGRDKWAEGAWGTTRSIINVLRVVFPNQECPDRALVPFFGWLLEQLPAEWKRARTWDEAGLGNAGHNWWLHTFLGFWQAGLYFPEIADWKRFRAFAPEYFERELSVLMEADGFTRERSGYHWGTVNHWLDYLHIAGCNGIPVSEPARRHLVKVAETVWKMRTPDGDIPRHGDTGPAHQPDNRLEKLREVAALFDLPEAKYVAEQLAPDWPPAIEGVLPGPGRNLMPEYRRLRSRSPKLPTADTELKNSGYYLMRQNWTRHSDWMSIEAGPVGPIVTSHDHTHQFNFELYSRGRTILIDNCSGPYGESPERAWRVSSASHNVATIDGADQLPIEQEWRWNGQLYPFVENWITNDQFAYFNGTHEGYRRLEEAVASARRKIFYLRGEYWILIDRFVPETEAEHRYTQHFHVGVPSRLEDKELVTTGEGGNLMLIPVKREELQIEVEPCPYPLEKYDNPDHLTIARSGTGKQLMFCLLVP